MSSKTQKGNIQMKNLRKVSGLAILLMLISAIPAVAQQANAVALPVHGTFAGGGDFTGTATINRFELRANQIVAIGFVRGTLSRGNHSVGTALTGEVAWPVTVTNGGGLSTTSCKTPAAAHLTRPTWSAQRQ